MTRVYVAAKFEEGPRVREVYEQLRAMGFEITHDWTNEAIPAGTPEEVAKFFESAALADYNGVLEADAVLVLNHDRLFGGATEMGLALAWGRTCYVVQPDIRDNIFYHLPASMGMRLFATLDEALAAIKEDSE